MYAGYIRPRISETQRNTALTVLLGLRGRGSKDRYPFLAAFTVITVFLFSVRMHERYLYPALALLMLAYICRQRLQAFTAA